MFPLEIFKKSVSQSTRNALKRIEMKKKFTLYEWHFPLPQNAQCLKKKSVSQSTRIALKRIENQKKIYPFDPLRASRIAQSPSGEAQLILPQVTPRVPRSVHAKFHADRTKTVVRRGILI